ncbi:MAG: hypothetical protein GQ547_05285 [Methylophaga sp.]|nr:hypothetical protein [Methylophaga sp.]
MSTIPALQSGISGIQSGMQSLNRNAAKIADANAIQSGADLTEPLVNMLLDKQQIQASAKVVEASSNMIGSILDIKA